MSRLAIPTAVLTVVLACGGEPPAASVADQAASKCPRVHLDKLAGDWVLATGDTKTRFRVVEQGGRTLLWYVDPAYSAQKLELVGTKRDKDWQFDELPRGRRKQMLEADAEVPKRIYLAPKPQRCAVEVYAGMAPKDGKEVMPPKSKEFLQFPDQPAVRFTYDPHDEPLFLGEAATSWAVAQKQVAELGGPNADVAAGKIPATAWTKAEADGGEGCVFTLDAYFDDQPVEGGQEVAAGVVVDGMRPWSFTFDAPYRDAHRFELHRYRTCGGARERLAVAGIDAILP